MRLILNQNFPGERVERLFLDDSAKGLTAQDFLVSEETYDKIIKFLKEQVMNNDNIIIRDNTKRNTG